MPSVQDLKSFRLPANFRGEPAWFVQLWWLVEATLFHGSPQLLYGFRNWLLRRFGARIGKGVRIRPTVEITYPWKLSIGDWCWIGDHVTLYTLGEIEVGENAVISQHSYICSASHDYTLPTFDVFDRPVHIGPEAWLATGVFVGPGVTIGNGAVIGARSVVLKDMPAMMVCAGYPAQVLRPRVEKPVVAHAAAHTQETNHLLAHHRTTIRAARAEGTAHENHGQ
jgi:putative colanic acid biosynthesis acetyltransferase WcaF